MRKILTGLLFFCFSLVAKAQNVAVENPKLKSVKSSISAAFNSKYQDLTQSKSDVLSKALQKGIPIFLDLENGVIAELKYFDEFEHPIYLTTYNNAAAQATGVSALHSGGILGQSLSGKGFVVGIYDQTRPKADHAEFTGRLTQIDGSTETISNHATHVSGTVLAAGINSSARGMAYEATGWSFNWDSDLSKMFANAYDPVSKANGHLVSNHSYGFLTGWYRNSTGAWAWAGNNSVDPNEDYRFGFYSSKSQGLDDLVFIRPYYTIVWAAGNDRSDVGNGTKPSDGPDDTIGSEGVAKNIITVGAVSLPSTYTGPSSVAMSNFSSWGPTDDGRIKPDVVGIGVNVFSSTIANGGANDSYGSLSGTSMAAPNVTGSLLLLQQLFSQRNNGRFMWASTVKGLVINTTKEAGLNPGPDYIYGWGLLDAEAAARIILNENGSSDIIREEVLGNGEVKEFEFVSDGVTPIRITIAWTDPAGNPPPISVDPQNLMLVNDLDLRVVDEEGISYFPWSLNPAVGSSAQAVRDRDNFRDNVEQIQIDSPKPQKYKVRISHKGTLVNGQQEVSLILKAGTTDGASETLYWIGGNAGDWNNPQNWSSSSQGVAANKIPGIDTRVVFDGGGSGNQIIGFPTNAEAFSINFFGNQLVKFDLKGNQVSVSSGFRVSNQITEIENGTLVFKSSSTNEHLVELGQAIFTNTNLNFESGKWKLLTAEVLDRISLENAVLTVDFDDLSINSLQVESTGTLGGSLKNLNFKNQFIVEAGGIVPSNLNLTFSGSVGELRFSSDFVIDNLTVQSGLLNHMAGRVNELAIGDGEYKLGQSSLEINSLRLGSGSIVNLGVAESMVVLDSISATASISDRAFIKSDSGSTLVHDRYLKYCLDNISVRNVNLEGQAVINLGVSAEIINAEGWLGLQCQDVLFANFNTTFGCSESLTSFQNLSEGAISSYEWDFGGLGTSSLANPSFIFNSPGIYLVKLIITNEEQSVTFQKEIQIGENQLSKPVIVVNGSLLTSQQPGNRYQWYLNGQAIEGATQRSLEALNDGNYQVAIFDDVCNRLSDPLVISSLNEADLAALGVFIGPVPSQDKIDITMRNDFIGEVSFSLIDLSGRAYLEEELSKMENELFYSLTLPTSSGVYILRIQTNNLIINKKVIKI